jgi:hypothetical protein
MKDAGRVERPHHSTGLVPRREDAVDAGEVEAQLHEMASEMLRRPAGIADQAHPSAAPVHPFQEARRVVKGGVPVMEHPPHVQ